MQELMDPRGDKTCGVCGQQRPASLSYSYAEDKRGGGKTVCVWCVREMVRQAPPSAWHPLPSDPQEKSLPPLPKRVREQAPPESPAPPAPPEYPYWRPEN